MTNEIACEECGNRLEDCTCEPGFPYLAFCPISIYDPANHDPQNCPYCGKDNEMTDEEIKRPLEYNGPGG